MRLVPVLVVLFISGFLFSCGSNRSVEHKDVSIQNLSSDPVLYSLNRAILNDPENVSYIAKRGEYFLEKGHPKYALKDALSLIILEEDMFESWYLLAKSQYALNNFKEAVNAGLHAEKFMPNHAELALLISRASFLNGDAVNADRYFQKSLQLVPGHAEIDLIRGMFSYAKGDTTGAINNLRTGFVKDGTNLNIIKELVKVYSASGKKDSAMFFVIAGQNYNPNDPYLLFSKASILEEKGLKESAFFTYNSALQADSQFIPANKRVAEIYFTDLKYEKAKGYLERIVTQDSSDISVNHMLAKIYENGKFNREAVILYKNILSRNSGDTTAQKSLERIYAVYPELAPIVKKDTVQLVEDVKTDSIAKKAVNKVNPKTETTVKEAPKAIKASDSVKPVKHETQVKQNKPAAEPAEPMTTPAVEETPAVVEEKSAPEPAAESTGENIAPATEGNKKKGLFKKK